MSRIHANNFGTTIAADITNVATTITLSSTTGLPAIGAGVTANLTLQSGSDIEIVTATALSGSDITVTRAQEGTSAMPFASGSSISLRPTHHLQIMLLQDSIVPQVRYFKTLLLLLVIQGMLVV
jgi:hypothetical protein